MDCLPFSPAPGAEDEAASVQSQADQIFAAAVRQVAQGGLDLPALIAAAERLRAAGALPLVAEMYRSWIAHNAQDPRVHAARFNFGVTLMDMGALPEARDALAALVAEHPDFSPAAINLGNVLERLGDRAGAIAVWQALANRLAVVTGETINFRRTALNQMGRVLEGARLDAPAEAALRASLEVDPGQRLVAQHFISLRQTQCSWPVLAPDGPMPPPALLACASPLTLAALYDDPLLLLSNAQRYYALDAEPSGAVTLGAWPPASVQPGRRLRVGYLSSDMREHAVGFLMAEVFELHDRARVEIFAYYCGPARSDSTQARYKQNADHWIDLTGLDDRAAAARMVADGIDILIDVNGYTKDARTKLYAYRPAPCLVNWLGFPGTLGTPHHHYIIADPFIIPEGDERFYTERVLRLPCYQPNDRKRVVSPLTPGRAALGLPEAAFVFCAFNGVHKITPEVFARWMRILLRVPESVLWVLCAEEASQNALRAHAERLGVSPARLVFAGRLENPDHVARYRCADLFLDSAPYGAHTTASDALWMGVPVLTCPGIGFAARVCGSLVRAAGLPELVCASWEEYETLAVALAQDPPRLAALRQRLVAGRDASLLFDTPGLVRALEDCFDTIWEEYCTGHQPVPELWHLPALHRIACEPDRPALPTREELLAWYDRRMAECAAVTPLPPATLLRAAA